MRGGDKKCTHSFIKNRNHRMRDPFVLTNYEVYVVTKCQMFERRQ